MKPKNKSLSVVIVLIAIYITTSCNLFEDTGRKVVGEYVYRIEPDTILQSIADQKGGIFSPINNESDAINLYPSSVIWRQSDYLYIADAFHRFVWNDAIYNWNVNYISFSLFCNQVDVGGFQQAGFSLFEDNAIDENSEIEHQIDIYPGRSLINAWEFAYDSKLPDIKSVKLTTAMLTADEILMAAERNGGSKNRHTLNNDCEISMILSLNSVDFRGWNVFYSPGNFSITIDPYTGNPID